MNWLAAHLVLVVTSVATAVAAGVLLRGRRSPQSTLAWLLAIVLVPYVGLPLYLALGARKRDRISAPPAASADVSPPTGEPDRMLRRYGLPAARPGSTVTVLGTGEDAYRSLIDLVEGARQSVWVEVFILGDDDAGRGLIEAMTAQAARGLDVRLLLDAVGSRPLPAERLEPLRRAGGRVAFYEPVLHRPFHGRTNLRNHRKIFLADETDAVAGGMNVAHEYMGPAPDSARWRDLSLRLGGPVVGDLAALFRSDWSWASRTALPPAHAAPEAAGDSTAQVVPAGPDVASDALFDVVLALSYGATERLWIVTPYFVPDDALSRALAVAARRGVDVRLVVPDPSNHRLADLARGPALRDLDEAGVTVLRYTRGMVHAKALVADDVAIVGSANLDPRSLFLNAEVAVVLYDAPEVETVARWVDALGDGAERGVVPVGATGQLVEGVARLVAPLL